MPYKIAFVSLGCAKNLVNTEQMMALCRQAGHTITGEPEGADVAVLNTCGFIESARGGRNAGHGELYRRGHCCGGADGRGEGRALRRDQHHL